MRICYPKICLIYLSVLFLDNFYLKKMIVKMLSVNKEISLNLYFLIISFIINILIIKSILEFLSFLKLNNSNSIKKGILLWVFKIFLLSSSNNFFLYIL